MPACRLEQFRRSGHRFAVKKLLKNKKLERNSDSIKSNRALVERNARFDFGGTRGGDFGGAAGRRQTDLFHVLASMNCLDMALGCGLLAEYVVKEVF